MSTALPPDNGPQNASVPSTSSPAQPVAAQVAYAPDPASAASDGSIVPARSSGLAIAALVVGIAAFLFGLIPVFGALVGIAAIVLAVLALRRKQSKGLAVTGLVLGALATIASIGTTAGIGAAVNNPVESSAVVAEAPAAPAVEEEAAPEAPAEPAEPVEVVAAEPEVSAEFRSALTKAESYSSFMHMSKAGLYDQLTSEYGEQFSPEAAQYAIDNVKADWNLNALEKAKTYQEQMAMSPDAIRDQLISEYGERFTPEEADYAIAHLND